MSKRIPIQRAKDIGKDLEYDQVIIVAWSKKTGITSVTTWGSTLEQCEQAAEGGNFVKKALGWPPEQCQDKPTRVKRKEKVETTYPDCGADLEINKVTGDLKFIKHNC